MSENLGLPASFFSIKQQTKGLLWLPPLSENHFSQKVDWLSGLSLSRGNYIDLKPWPEKLEKILEEEELKLDKKPKFDHSILMIKLPKGFKSSMAIMVKDCPWDSPDNVFFVYSKHTKGLNPDLIQSPYIWSSQPSQLLKEIQWINL